MTAFIGIISSKGGVGKTTATVNLAGALSFFNRKVIALDANLSNPNVGIHLGVYNPERTLHSALRGEHNIRESVYSHPSGVQIIPGSISYRDAKTVDRGNLLNTILGLKGAAEAVIMDSSPGLGEDSQSVIRASDYLLLVTTPDIVSVGDSLKAIKLADEHKKRVLGVIVNMQRDGDMTPENVAQFLGRPVIGVIPYDRAVSESLTKRQPLSMTADLPSVHSYKTIAGHLIGQKYEAKAASPPPETLMQTFLRRWGLDKI
jgi:MinD-like ATPase involved in chromosome partitioning or flagellar assembly